MLNITSRTPLRSGYLTALVADAEADLEALTAMGTEYAMEPGSRCLCMENSKTYRMKSDGSWVYVKSGGGSGPDEEGEDATEEDIQDIIDNLFGE